MEKEVFIFFQKTSESWGQLQCDKGIQERVISKTESIRITLSDLDPQQVAIRETGHFQPCFPDSSPVSRPVFPSKVEGRHSLRVQDLIGVCPHEEDLIGLFPHRDLFEQKDISTYKLECTP